MKSSVLISHFKLSLDIIYNTRWRNFWTILGIVIGLSSVIMIVAIGDGIKQQVNYQLNDSSSHNKFVIQPKSINQPDSKSNFVTNLENISPSGSLNYLDVAGLNSFKGVSNLAPYSILRTKIIGTVSSYKSGVVVGTNQYLNNYLSLSVNAGSFIDQPGNPINSAVIGQNLAEKLFGEITPLGATVNINGSPFIVEGVLNPVTNIPFSQLVDFNNSVFIDYDAAQNISSNNAFVYQIFMTINTNKNSVVKSLQSHLDEINGNQSNTLITTLSGISYNSKRTLDLLTRLISFVAAISLLVGGVGIMNVMLVSIAERTHEIGIRKAIGATNRQIIFQFLVESAILSFVGGIIGIVLSYLIDLFIILSTSVKPIITWQLVVFASLISIIIGLIFGSIPAIKAAKKLPIDSLRSS